MLLNSVMIPGFPQVLESLKSPGISKYFFMALEKSWNLTNCLKVLEKSWNFDNISQLLYIVSWTSQLTNFVQTWSVYICKSIFISMPHVTRVTWNALKTDIFLNSWGPCDAFLRHDFQCSPPERRIFVAWITARSSRATHICVTSGCPAFLFFLFFFLTHSSFFVNLARFSYFFLFF